MSKSADMFRRKDTTKKLLSKFSKNDEETSAQFTRSAPVSRFSKSGKDVQFDGGSGEDKGKSKWLVGIFVLVALLVCAFVLKGEDTA